MNRAARNILRQAAVRAGLEAIALSRAGRLWPAAGGRGVIFTLHHVRPREAKAFDPNAHLSVTPEFLEEAILAAGECGLTPVALEELPSLLADRGDRRRFVSFTLDDGYRNNAAFAAPVFRKHSVPYTIFVTAGFVERSRAPWWETAGRLVGKLDRLEFDFGHGAEALGLETDARKQAAFERLAEFVQAGDEDEAVARIDEAARNHGVDPLAMVAELTMDAGELRCLAKDPLARFGAHTLTHANLRRVDDQRLRREITESAKAVEAYVGRYPRSFAFPYGFPSAVGDREIRAVAEAGFEIAVTTQPGVLRASSLEQQTVFNRVSLNGLYQQKRYVKALISGLPFKLMR
ncbi:MAG TPA: polysaccharide deacetylase family protein [Rhizobiaceae bacterium]|nr:polysaccharide deacetylase family protein [Rhizobiaceae bacterium]